MHTLRIYENFLIQTFINLRSSYDSQSHSYTHKANMKLIAIVQRNGVLRTGFSCSNTSQFHKAQYTKIYKIIIIIISNERQTTNALNDIGETKATSIEHRTKAANVLYARIAIIHRDFFFIYSIYSFLFFSLQNALHGTAGCLTGNRFVSSFSD